MGRVVSSSPRNIRVGLTSQNAIVQELLAKLFLIKTAQKSSIFT
jgi:hypothetical protein